VALTKGEVVQVLGRTIERIGMDLDDPDTPNKVSKEEILQLIQDVLTDLLKEFSD